MPAIILFTIALLIGVPIAFALAIAALALIGSGGDWVLLLSFHQQWFGGLENYGLLALPLFILVGELMASGGMGRRLIAMASLLTGSLRGALAYTNLLANGLMASILGSAAAQIALMTRIMTPEMERAGYRRRFAIALTSAGGLLAPILPPSMVFVVYGVLAQASIGDLFIAGVVPGLLLISGFLLLIICLGRRGEFPNPAIQYSQFSHAQPSHADQTTHRASVAIGQGLPALAIPAIIFVSILSGLATPTESAALAAVATFLIGKYLYGELNWRDIPAACRRAALSSGAILMLVGCAQIFGFVITYQQVPAAIAQWLTEVAQSPLAFLLLVNLLLLLVGMFIDAIAALILAVPILLPIATSRYGIDPYHFGVVVCLNLAVGLLTPPTGAGLFIAAATSGEKVESVSKALLPFVGVAIAVLLLLSFFPALTRWLL